MWWLNGKPEQDQLNSYWDAAVSGTSPEALAQAAPGLDPNLQEAIAQVRALHRRRRPDPAFALHLETTLMNAFATSAIASPAIRPVSPKQIVTRPAWLPGRDQQLPRRWGLGALATVALIAITLAIFFFTLRGDDQPAIVPGTPDGSPTSTVAPAPTQTVEPVSMYRGGLERTGVMPGPAPAGRPGVLWRADVESEVQGPVVVGAGLVFAGTLDGSVHAFDTITGAEVWKLTANATIESPSIVLDGATAYIAGFDGMVLAVDAATGAELWRTDPALNVSRRVAFDAASSTIYVGGLDPVSYAFDSTNGQIRWQADIGGPQQSVSSVVAADTLYFGAADGLLYALNTADGSTRWTYGSTYDGFGSLTFASNTVFLPANADGDWALLAIDASAGTERWRLSSTEAPYSAAAVVDGNVIVGTDLGEVLSVSATDGEVNWSFATGNGAGFWGPPGIVGDEIYVYDIDGSLYALDAATGGELWRVKLDGGINYNPAITGGVIYLGTWEGSIYALGDGGTELPTGDPAALQATPEASPSPAALADVELLWETTGGDGGLDIPSTLTIAPDGTIWVADAGHDRFQIFDADGNFLERWGGAGTDVGAFRLETQDGDPFCAIAFAQDGSIFVLEPANQRVQVFAADRSFERTIGEPGRQPGQFVEPMDIAIDPSGNLAVLDDARGDVQTFRSDGTLVATIKLQSTYSGPETVTSMAIDAEGNFYVAETPTQPSQPMIVEKFGPEGNLLQQFGLEPGPGQFLDQPGGIAIDGAGNLYVAEIGGRPRVVVFSPEGEYLMEFGGPGSPEVSFDFPWAIALDGQGNVYVTDGFDQLVKLRLPPPLRPLEPAASPTR